MVKYFFRNKNCKNYLKFQLTFSFLIFTFTSIKDVYNDYRLTSGRDCWLSSQECKSFKNKNSRLKSLVNNNYNSIQWLATIQGLNQTDHVINTRNNSK